MDVLKEVATDKSYDVIGVNDECDRELYVDAFVDGCNYMIEKAVKWLQGQEILLGEEDIEEFRKAMEE